MASVGWTVSGSGWISWKLVYPAVGVFRNCGILCTRCALYLKLLVELGLLLRERFLYSFRTLMIIVGRRVLLHIEDMAGADRQGERGRITSAYGALVVYWYGDHNRISLVHRLLRVNPELSGLLWSCGANPVLITPHVPPARRRLPAYLCSGPSCMHQLQHR